MAEAEPAATVLILAGGKSSRMKADKRFLQVGGHPLILKSFLTARAAGFPVRVLLSDADELKRLVKLLGPEADFCIDDRPGAGPLAALADALPDLQTEYGLLLAVDYPYLSSRLLRKLAQATKHGVLAVVPIADGIPQYACGLYHRSLAASARDAVDSGMRSLKGWVASLGSSVVLLEPQTWQRWADPIEFTNWNRPDDIH